MRSYILLICFFFCLSSLLAQVSKSFALELSSPDDLFGKSIIKGVENEVYLLGRIAQAGTNDQSLLLKYDLGKGLIWANKIGDANSFVRPANMIKAKNGDVILINDLFSGPLGGGTDILLMRWTPEGNLLWQTILGSSKDDSALSLTELENGDIIIGGATLDASNFTDFLLLKTDKDGNYIKSKSWGGASYEYCFDLKVNDKGNILLGGRTRSFSDDGSDEMILCEIDTAFAQLNSSVFQSSDFMTEYLYKIEDLGNGKSLLLGSLYGLVSYAVFEPDDQKAQFNSLAVGEVLSLLPGSDGQYFMYTHLAGVTEFNLSGEKELLFYQQSPGLGDAKNGMLRMDNGQLVFGGWGENPDNARPALRIIASAADAGPACSGYRSVTDETSTIDMNIVRPAMNLRENGSAVVGNISVTDYSLSSKFYCEKNCETPSSTFTYQLEEMMLRASLQENYSLDTTTITWDWGPGQSNELAPNIQFESPGKYMLCAEIKTPCGQSSSCQEIEILATHTSSIEELGIKLWPNPGRENIFLSGFEKVPQNIKIYNALGQYQQIENDFDGNTLKLYFGKERAGLYIIQFQLENGKTYSTKLYIQ